MPKCLLEIYEILRREYKGRLGELQRLLSAHALQDRIVALRKGREIVGAALLWQVEDVLDVDPEVTPPSTLEGKYLCLPVVYIEPQWRGYTALRALLRGAFESWPRAERLAFWRAPVGHRRRHKKNRRVTLHVMRKVT